MTTTVTPSVSASLTELVAEEIRALLARRRIRQSQLARALGVSEQWVSVRLMGKQEIGFNEAQRIADFLEVDVMDFMPQQREGKLIAVGGASRPTRAESKPCFSPVPKRPGPNGPRNRAVPTPQTTRTGRVSPALTAA